MSEKPHREIIEERHKKVAQLIWTKNESEIAKILGVSRRTILRDVKFLKQSAVIWLDKLAKGDYIFQYKLGLDRIGVRIAHLEELFYKTDDVTEKKEIGELLTKHDKLYYELLSGTPTVYSLKKAVEEDDVQAT